MILLTIILDKMLLLQVKKPVSDETALDGSSVLLGVMTTGAPKLPCVLERTKADRSDNMCVQQARQ